MPTPSRRARTLGGLTSAVIECAGRARRPETTLVRKSGPGPIADTARWEFSVAAKVFAHSLGEHEYIVGERFSVADILLANTLAWARRYDLPFEDERLDAYAKRLFARPALARAIAKETPQ